MEKQVTECNPPKSKLTQTNENGEKKSKSAPRTGMNFTNSKTTPIKPTSTQVKTTGSVSHPTSTKASNSTEKPPVASRSRPAESSVTFTVPLQEQTVTEQDAATFVCEVSKPNKVIQWFKNGEEIKPDDHFQIVVEGTVHKLIIKDSMLDDTAEYTAKIGDALTAAKLQVNELPLDFKKPLKDFRCTENETVTSEAELNKPDVPVTWLMNGQPISADTEFTIKVDDITSSGKLMVDEKPAEFTAQLKDQKVVEGESVEFTLKLNKSDIQVKWAKGKDAVPDERFTATNSDTEYKLTITDVKLTDADTYTVTLPSGKTCKTKLMITAKPLGIVTDLQGQEVMETEEAEFTIELNKPDQQVVWYHKGKKVVAGDKYVASSEGNVYKLIIKGCTLEDTADVEMTVEKLKSTAKLTVIELQLDVEQLFSCRSGPLVQEVVPPTDESESDKESEIIHSSYKPKGWELRTNRTELHFEFQGSNNESEDDTDGDPTYHSDTDDIDSSEDDSGQQISEVEVQEANEEANEDVKEQRQDLARENSVVEREKNATGIDQGSKYKKPARPCPFCQQCFANLPRHFTQKHHDKDEVKKLNGMANKYRIAALDLLRKRGIELKNRQIVSQQLDTPLYQERKSKKGQNQLSTCAKCGGYFNSKFILRHKRRCKSQNSPSQVNPQVTPQVETAKADRTKEDTLWQRVLAKMKDGEVKNTLMADEMILEIGRIALKMRKPNKLKKAIDKARNEMRLLAKLTIKANLKIIELFSIDKMDELEDALSSIGEGKPGLLTNLGNLVKKSCKNLGPYLLRTSRKKEASTLKEFLDFFASPAVYAQNFAASEYELKKKRQSENRKPARLPDEDDFNFLLSHLINDVKQATEPETKGEYVALRWNLHALLTLYNGRRGNEVSEISITDWKEKDSWLETELSSDYHVLFIMGKNDQLLPVFVPKYCTDRIDSLADSEVRQKVGVDQANEYLFAYTGDSTYSVLGYNEIQAVCQKLKIPMIDATSNRHRASTRLWQLDLGERHIEELMAHIGHSTNIDKNIYQCPPVRQLLNHVAPVLERITQGASARTNKEPRDEMEIDTSDSEEDSEAGSRKVHLLQGASTRTNKNEVPRKEIDTSDSEIETSDSERKKAKRKRKAKAGSNKRRKAEETLMERVKWPKAATQLVNQTFADYVTGRIKHCYPGKKGIEAFQAKSCAFIKTLSWEAVKRKIFNEKKTLCQKMKKMEK